MAYKKLKTNLSRHCLYLYWLRRLRKTILKELVNELDLEAAQVMFFKDIGDDLKNALIAKSNIFVMPSIIAQDFC